MENQISFPIGELGDSELTIVVLLSILALGILAKSFTSKSKYAVWSPLTIFGVGLIYYVIIGPTLSIINGNTFLRLIDHRPYYLLSWLGAGLYTICFLIGFILGKPKKNEETPISEMFSIELFKKQVIRLFIITLSIFIIHKGFAGLTRVQFWQTNYVEIESLIDVGGFYAYLGNSFNLFIVCAPAIVYLYRKKELSFFTAGGMLFVILALCISGGFRYRLVIVVFSSMATWYFAKDLKVKIVPLGVMAFGFLLFMGVMQKTREYGKGLDFDKVENKTISETLEDSFNESAIFQASGLIMFETDRIFPSVGFSPVIQSLVSPIPRFFWRNKPTGEHLQNIELAYQVNSRGTGSGQAIMSYGEYFMMFRWWGIVFMSLFIGYFFGRTGSMVNVHANTHPWFFIFKVLSAGYLYVVISRGYTPQQFMLYFFTVFPAYFLYKRSLKK